MLWGCIVGVVDRKNVLPQPNIGVGDLIVGIGSDGLHTNGFFIGEAGVVRARRSASRRSYSDFGADAWRRVIEAAPLLLPRRGAAFA